MCMCMCMCMCITIYTPKSCQEYTIPSITNTVLISKRNLKTDLWLQSHACT